jgi:hypothetical protein
MNYVIPAKAGIQQATDMYRHSNPWIPVSTGMTRKWDSTLNTIIPVIHGFVLHINMKYRKWKNVIYA